MSWIDICIVLTVALSALIGLYRGLTKELISLATLVVAFWLAFRYSKDLAVWLPQSLDRASFAIVDMNFDFSNLRVGIAFLLLLISTLFAGAILNYVIGHLIARRSLNVADRLVGLIFGVVRGGAIVLALVMVVGLTRFPETPWWRDARLLHPFEQAAVWVIKVLPPKYARHFSFE